MEVQSSFPHLPVIPISVCVCLAVCEAVSVKSLWREEHKNEKKTIIARTNRQFRVLKNIFSLSLSIEFSVSLTK